MVTAIITLTNVDGVEDTDTAFVAVYSLLFALLLSVYECSHCGCWYEEIEERCGGFYRKVSKMIDRCLIDVVLYIEYFNNLLLKMNCIVFCSSSQNFGFLYSAISRGLFLIFIALLQFGMEAGPGSGDVDENWLGIMTGTFLVVEGVVMIVIACLHPELMKEEKRRRPQQQQSRGQV